MSLLVWESLPRSSVKALLGHLGEIDDPREPWRVAHPLCEVLLLVVCATVCDCDDYDAIAEWGEAHLAVLRRYLPYHHGVPGGRWLTLLMNRIDPDLFAQVFTDWVRATWLGRLDLVAIDGKTSRRSHDRTAGTPPLHTVSAFATTARLVLGQEAVPDKASETTAIPILLERLSERDGLKGAIVSIHAVPTNSGALAAFRAHVVDLWRRTLRRRSQKDASTWTRIARIAHDWLPKPRILHPWPHQRFVVKHPRWEPYAGIPLVRICTGGAP